MYMYLQDIGQEIGEKIKNEGEEEYRNFKQ